MAVSRCILVVDMVSDGDTRRLHATLIERGSHRTSEDLRRPGLGLCECGCGAKTEIAKRTRAEAGWIRGEPLRFIRGHQNRTKQRPPLGPEDYAVKDHGWETPCWIRKGFTTNKGYSRVTIAGKNQYAHRVMYEQEIGPIPKGMELDHLCRQTKCIRPDHLEPVTRATNLQRGNGAKLTMEQVLEIRAAPMSVMTKDLAARYGISESQMSRVRRGVRWAGP